MNSTVVLHIRTAAPPRPIHAGARIYVNTDMHARMRCVLGTCNGLCFFAEAPAGHGW
eukprot:COSAG02_NODE_62442_length_266_cov_0.544910_1_plen_56_part_10